MPELPEVEVVRRGVDEHVTGRTIASAVFTGHRVARRHVPGPQDLSDRLAGRAVTAADRRGKYLWLVLDDADALIVHLGMSGQLLVVPAGQAPAKHEHARFGFTTGESELAFVDQRTFGGMAFAALEASSASADHPHGVPAPITHIARDLLESDVDLTVVARAARRRHSAIKRALLDQSLVSGIGNIYADEALWRAQVHGERWCDRLTAPAIVRVLEHARDVMTAALDQGGTSFDALYVNVNGASGYFDRSLNAYGQAGKPCARCGTVMVREQFMNRSSFSCPTCQPRPRISVGAVASR